MKRGYKKMKKKSDIINRVSDETGLPKIRAKEVVNIVFGTIAEYMGDGENVQLIGFGNFEVRERSARKGRNPQTGKEILIEASKVPAFKAGKALKERVK